MAAALNCAADEHPLRSQLERVKSPILSVSRDSGGKRRSVIAAAPILSVFAGTKAGSRPPRSWHLIGGRAFFAAVLARRHPV